MTFHNSKNIIHFGSHNIQLRNTTCKYANRNVVVKSTVNVCSSEIALFLGQVQSFFGDESGNERQKQGEIKQFCLGGDLIYRVALCLDSGRQVMVERILDIELDI